MTGKIGTPSLQPKSNFRSFVLESRFYSNRGDGDQRGARIGDAQPGPRAAAVLTFKLGMDHKGLVGGAPAYVEDVWLAADLTVFDVALVAAGGLIDDSLVPLPAACALKS
jgi:hypothetical protein